MTEWLSVWIESGISKIYNDNKLRMPFVTGDPSNQPDISDWMCPMPCGCVVFYKGYCLHTSSRCNQHGTQLTKLTESDK